MLGGELRRRLDRPGLPYTWLAPLLGLSIHALHHQMRGVHPVSRQTELLLEHLKKAAVGLDPASPNRGMHAGAASALE